MKKGYILILAIFICSASAWAQEGSTSPFLNSAELSYESGSAGGDYGLQFKVNHLWWAKGRTSFNSGLSFTSFWGSEKIDGTYSQTTGFTTDNHLRFYTGTTFKVLKRGFLSVEGYLGGYNAYTKGTIKNEGFGVDREYVSSQWSADFGSRLCVGYHITERIGLQLSINNSWKQLNSGLGPLAGIFAGEPDGKMSTGFGIRYRL